MFAPLRLIARRHLFERPVRTMITILGVGLGVSVSVAIRTANVDVLRSFEETVSAVAGGAALQGFRGGAGAGGAVVTGPRPPPGGGAPPPGPPPGGRGGGRAEYRK